MVRDYFYTCLQDNYNELSNIVEIVKRDITGRIADEQNNTLYMLETLIMAGGGDHLEIGTLFGGSAIAAALTKQRYKLEGDIYCIDPLDGYYGTGVKDQCDLVPSVEIFMKNLRDFKVEGIVYGVPEKSHPFPNVLARNTFTTAYIDGDHWGTGPMNDWWNVKDRVKNFVVFDNADVRHPAILETIRYIEDNEKDWSLFFRGGITAIVRRKDG